MIWGKWLDLVVVLIYTAVLFALLFNDKSFDKIGSISVTVTVLAYAVDSLLRKPSKDD